MGGEWTAIRLGDVCTKIGSGATPRGGSEVYLETGPFALIRSQNVYNDGFHHDGLAYISDEQAAELANVEVLRDDVLLNITGDSVARACQVDCDVLPARVNQHVAILRPDRDRLDPRFLRYFLVSREMQSKLLSWAGSGGTRNALTKGMIESFDVYAPEDISEQRAIAAILGTLDDKIELNRRTNETLEAMARALFKSWFVDFLPVRANMARTQTGDPVRQNIERGRGKPVPAAGGMAELDALFSDSFVDSELGRIPKGWVVGTTDQIIAVSRDAISPQSSPDETFDHYSLPAFDEGRRPAVDLGRDIKSNKFPVPENAVLLSKLNPHIPRVWLAHPDSERRAVCSTEFLVCTPRGTVGLEFIYCLLSSPDFLRGFASLVTGTTGSHQRVKPEAFLKLNMVSPDNATSEAFSRLAAPHLELVAANIAEQAELAAARDALLPKLLSGEIRIKDAEKFVEDVA